MLALKNYFILIALCISLCVFDVCKIYAGVKEDLKVPVKIETLKTNRAAMKFFRFGSGNKKFIIIPGMSAKSLMGAADVIAAQYKIFARDYEIFVFDIRDELPEKYNIQDLAGDLIEALDTLEIKQADFLGVSMGGMIAQCIVLKRPDLIHKLVIGSSASRVKMEAAKFFEDQIKFARDKNIKGLINHFIDHVYSPDFIKNYREVVVNAYSDLNDKELEKFITIAEAVKNFDIYDSLHALKIPVLVIGADKDEIFGADSSREISEKTGGKLYIYQDQYHAAYDEAKDYQERVLNFFSE